MPRPCPQREAVGLYRYLPSDDPEALLDLTLDTPLPGERDLLVAVRAVSVNPVDTKVRRPRPHVEARPRILGWDVAGVVEAVGPGVTLFRPGDEVYYAGSITRPGGNSEYHLVDERIVGPKPRSLDFAGAAALPLTTITAGHPLVEYIFCLQDNDRYWAARAQMIAPQGKICSIVETRAPVDIGLLQRKSATFAYELMFTRAIFETHDMIEQHRLLSAIAELIDVGALRATASTVLRPIDAANLRRAHAMLGGRPHRRQDRPRRLA